MADSEMVLSDIRSGPSRVQRFQALARIGSFWRLQATGWFAYLVVHFLGALANGEPATIVWSSLSTAVAGFSLTSLMRPLLMRVWDRPVSTAAGLALGLSLIFAIPFSAVSETSYWLATGGGWRLNDPVTYFGSAFWCGSILLTWTGIYFGIEYYRQAQQERATALKAESAAHQAKLESLCYQLNPHFLFNTLNGISTLILDGKNQAAGHMLERLSQLLRESLDGDPRDKIPVAEELRLAQVYLAIEQVRFDDRLTFKVDMAEDARDARVPRLILQPLIENSICHAVRPSSRPVAIEVAIRANFNRLRIEVTDDGPGIPEGTYKAGIGHKNIQQRLRALYGSNYRFGIDNDPRGGTRVEVELPLEVPA